MWAALEPWLIPNPLLPMAVVAVGLLPVSVVELRTGEISNHVTLPGVVVGLALSLFDHRPAVHLWGLALAAVVGLVLWRHNLLGGGAVKLIAALGAVLGPLVVASCVLSCALPVLAAWAGLPVPFARDGRLSTSPYFACGVLLATLAVLAFTVR